MTRVDELWEAIAATTDRTSIFRRVDETHPLSLYAGIDHDGRRGLMLVTAQTPPQLPPPGIVHVVCNQRENGEFAIILQLGRPEFDEVFGRLCQDLVDATRTAVPALGAEAVLRRLGRWRKLLEVGERTTLSDIALRGLIGELWFLQHVALHRLGAMLAFAKPGEVPQVALAVWARHMSGKFPANVNFQNIQEVAAAIHLELLHEPISIVLGLFRSFTRRKRRQVANCLPERYVFLQSLGSISGDIDTGRRCQLATEITGYVRPCSNDELPLPLLGHSQLGRLLHLPMDPVAHRPCFVLHLGEVLAALR